MNKDDRTFLIVSFMVIILLLFAVGSLYMMKENEKEKRVGLQRQVDALVIEKQNLELRLKESEVSNAQASSTIKFQEERISFLSRELEDEKSSSGKNIVKIQEKEFEIQNLKARIEDIKSEKQETQRNSEKLNEEYLNIKFQMENLIKTKEELEKRAKELVDKEGVSLGTVVIKRPNN
ncbi:MAG: hypothetical protein Q8R38_01710 [Candidatus Omnitrophota bacterium]|nr:hypothetical protein [Candidatus Omnitrophota bacterium]